MANFTAGTSFSDGVTNDVTAAKLNALVADAVPTSNLSLTSTTGTIATFNSTTGTIATLNSTTGTIATLNSTTGTIATLNSTTGTIPTLVATTLVTTGTGTAAAPAIVPTGDTNTGIFFPAADTIAFSEGGAEAMRIDSSGNVGIGTSSLAPGHRVSLTGDGSTITGGLVLNTNSNLTYVSAVSPSSADFEMWNSANGYVRIGTNSQERLRIDSSGNLLVGTATAIGKFTVEAAGGGVSTTPITTNSITGAGTRFAAGFYYSGAKVGGIEVTASATSYVTSSDYRLKTNLEPISNGIERVKQLPVYRFNWIADQSGNKVDGFVAHEAKQIIPECVSGEKDAVDADGKPIYQGIDQSKIVPLLTAALKEAIAKIETLEAKVTALEAA